MVPGTGTGRFAGLSGGGNFRGHALPNGDFAVEEKSNAREITLSRAYATPLWSKHPGNFPPITLALVFEIVIQYHIDFRNVLREFTHTIGNTA